jgi:hypothetical protein
MRNRVVQGHTSTPITTQPQINQQRKRQRVNSERASPVQSLIDGYHRREAATARFPPKISQHHIRSAMRRYEDVIQDACISIENSCASCGEFGSKLTTVGEDRLRLMKAKVEAKFGVQIELDDCSFADGAYRLCQTCFDALDKGKIPKFSAMNAVNVTMCQRYPAELEDLTLIEEYAIARSHPIAAILKLKPNGMQNPTAYNGIRGHIVTLPQNPGPLLDILPSPGLHFYDRIGIVWTGKTKPTIEDLRPFVEVRKEKVIRALLWLCENNPLYESVQINHDLIDQWTESFVPRVLEEAVVHVPEDNDSGERGTYSGDMEGLAENDLHNALDDMADGRIASGAVYSDVEGQRLNPELKMVMALTEMMNEQQESTSNAHVGQTEGKPVITWTGGDRNALMNDYEDRDFFTSAFPTLFPFGIGGHMPLPTERRTPVSLETWGKWLMNHHSRR